MNYLRFRILRVIPVFFLVTFASFALLNILPGDAADAILGGADAMRVLRVDLIAALQEDYIALARAKGMSTSYILFRHALRPSSFTLVTVLGLQFGFLLSGTVIIEQIFSLPGMGKLILDAIDNRDSMLLQGGVTLIALA